MRFVAVRVGLAPRYERLVAVQTRTGIFQVFREVILQFGDAEGLFVALKAVRDGEVGVFVVE